VAAPSGRASPTSRPATVALLESRTSGSPSPFTDPGIVRSICNGGNTLSRILAMVVIFFLEKWDLPLNLMPSLMPSGATNAMLGITSPVLFAGQNPFAWWLGALVLAGWCLLPAVVGVLSTVRRDVA
jgi:hypothetical protein